MEFTLKDPNISKCNSCIHAHILSTDLGTVTICQILGGAVKKIKECNKYTSIAHGPVPMHMAMQAWSIDKTTKVVGKVGFSGTPIEQTDVEIEPPGPKLVPVDNPDTFLEPDEDEDDED